jgi:hypothetical protein
MLLDYVCKTRTKPISDMTMMKKITQVSQKIYGETGEVKEELRVGYLEREPDYIKLYLQGILLYSECPPWQNRVLHALLKRINYQNEISLPVGYKREIIKELGIGKSSLDNAISAFVKAKLLIRKDVGVYLANPHLFGRGEWKDIKKLRLTVDFSVDGVQMTGNVEREQSDENVIEGKNQEMLASILPVDPVKLMAFLKNPANHTEAIALSSIAMFLSFSMACLNQLFA